MSPALEALLRLLTQAAVEQRLAELEGLRRETKPPRPGKRQEEAA